MGIINELYDTDLFAFTEIKEMGEEYIKAFEKTGDMEQRLLEAFPQCEELFREYQNAELDAENIVHKHEFNKGFRAGARIVLEITEH